MMKGRLKRYKIDMFTVFASSLPMNPASRLHRTSFEIGHVNKTVLHVHAPVTVREVNVIASCSLLIYSTTCCDACAVKTRAVTYNVL